MFILFMNGNNHLSIKDCNTDIDNQYYNGYIYTTKYHSVICQVLRVDVNHAFSDILQGF